MSTQTNNNIRSEDVQLRFFEDANTERVLNHISISIKENATEGVDSICGQKSDDPYTVFNFWDVDFEGTQKDLALIDAYLANIAAKQANTGENPAVAIFEAVNKKAVTTTYTFSGITRKPVALSASGRADPFKISTGFKAKNFKKT
jgi:hypothetical protein